MRSWWPVGVFVLAACGSSKPAPINREAADRGARAMAEFKETLLGMLTSTMQAQGPVAAIEVCSATAPGLGQRQDGITVGRTTRKPRNPANTALGWRAEALAHFEAMPSTALATAPAYVRALDGGTTAVATPLMIKEPCLTCHGGSLAPEIAAAIASRYPADQATGYSLGELRGITWAEVR